MCKAKKRFLEKRPYSTRAGRKKKKTVNCWLMLKLDILRRRRREKFERRFGIEMCVPVWPELANFGEIFKFSGNFYRVNNYFVKHWTHFGKLSAIGYILIVLSGLILSKSSCLLVTLTFREGRVWSNSLPRYVGRWLPSKLRQA